MATRVTIDQLPEKMTLAGTEFFVIQDGSTTRKIRGSILDDTAETALSGHLTDADSAHAASAVSAAPAGGSINGANVQAQLGQLAAATGTAQTDATAAGNAVVAHINDTTAAHVASAIGATPIGVATGTDVQAQVGQLSTAVTAAQSSATGAQTAINAHISNPTDAHDASAISYVPAGAIAATDVQGAITEVANERVIIGGGINTIMKMTQAEYDALGAKDSTTLYVIS